MGDFFERYKKIVFTTGIPEGEEGILNVYDVIKYKDFRKIVQDFKAHIKLLQNQRDDWKRIAQSKKEVVDAVHKKS